MGKHDPHPPKPIDHHVTVHVVDLNNKGISLARAIIADLNSAQLFTAITDGNGDAYFPSIPNSIVKVEIKVDRVNYLAYSGAYDMTPDYDFFPIALTPVPVEPEPWNDLTKDQLRAFKGNFCGYTIPGLPLQNFNVAYTPAYLVYDNSWRAQFRSTYPGTHFPVVILNGPIYNSPISNYGNLNLSTSDKRIALKELYNAGLIPVVNVLSDPQTEVSDEFKLLSDLIRIAFVKWEMNENDDNNTLVMMQLIIKAKNAIRKDAILYVHFSPEHSSGVGTISVWYNPSNPSQLSTTAIDGWIGIIPGNADSNGLWWNWAKAVGVQGILLQADIDQTLEETISLINDFTQRFGTGYHGWPTGMDCVVFEVKARKRFYNEISEVDNTNFNNSLRNHTYDGKQPEGWCNG